MTLSTDKDLDVSFCGISDVREEATSFFGRDREKEICRKGPFLYIDIYLFSPLFSFLLLAVPGALKPVCFGSFFFPVVNSFFYSDWKAVVAWLHDMGWRLGNFFYSVY